MIMVTRHVRSIVDHDGAVLLDVSHNSMITLDSTGAYIWQRLERGLQIDAIVAELARETGADEGVIAKDVAVFMEQLQSKRLVEMALER